jgi:hypothetical protein
MILQASCLDNAFTLTLPDKAKSLAVISLLTDISDTELMKTYLDYFSQALTQLKSSVVLLKSTSDISSSTTPASILIETVRLLQSAILDTHILFFHQVSTLVPNETLTANGLLSKSKSMAIQEILKVFNVDCTSFDFLSFFQQNTSQHLLLLKNMFSTWLNDTLPLIHFICDEVLSLTESAADVASLQHVIWTRSCHATVENTNTVSNVESDKQHHWEEASKEFLLHIKRRRNEASSQDNGIVKGGTLLWNSVFKVPFLKQVSMNVS